MPELVPLRMATEIVVIVEDQHPLVLAERLPKEIGGREPGEAGADHDEVEVSPVSAASGARSRRRRGRHGRLRTIRILAAQPRERRRVLVSRPLAVPFPGAREEGVGAEAQPRAGRARGDAPDEITARDPPRQPELSILAGPHPGRMLADADATDRALPRVEERVPSATSSHGGDHDLATRPGARDVPLHHPTRLLKRCEPAITGSRLPPPLAAVVREASPEAGDYPPALTGMRGSHAGSFEVAHAFATEGPGPAAFRARRYDLIVVGAGSPVSRPPLPFAPAGRPRASSSWTTTTTSGVTPSATSFATATASASAMAAPRRSIPGHRPTARKPSRADPRGWRRRRSLLSGLRSETLCVARLESGAFFYKDTFGVDRLVAGEGLLPCRSSLAPHATASAAQRDLVRLDDASPTSFRVSAPTKRSIGSAAMSYKSSC